MKRRHSILWILMALVVSAAIAAPILQEGPATITEPGVSEVNLSDLGLRVGKNATVDLGKFYTQSQIFSSVDLKKAIDAGRLDVAFVGTTPDIIPVGGGATPSEIEASFENALTSQGLSEAADRAVSDVSEILAAVTVSSTALVEVFSVATSTERKGATGQNSSDEFILRAGRYPTGTGDPKAYILANGLRVDPGSAFFTATLGAYYAIAEPGSDDIPVLREIER